MKIEEIGIWEAFQGVAVHGGFSKASKVLRVTVPQLSKRVAKLEDRLGVRLFQRSTRVVTLTDEGRALLPRVTSLLDDLTGIESSFESGQSLTGTVRITCVPFVAHRLLIPVIAGFSKVYPEIHIELELSESFVNLIEANFDLAIRIHPEPDDSDLVYRKLAPNDLVLCASPGYLKAGKRPLDKPADLRHHKMLMLSVHRDCGFKNGSHALREFEGSKRLTCENGAFLTELALNDFGVLVRSIWDVQGFLENGELVQVLKKYPLETFGNVYAVIPSRRYLAPRVRAFLDFVVKRAAEWKVS
jgi:DNA-binding transcriptional LysR family regulator